MIADYSDSDKIINNTNKIIKCLTALTILNRNNFFNEGRLRDLYNIMNEDNHIGSYTTSIKLLPKYIKLELSNQFFIDYNFGYDSLLFINTLNNAIRRLLMNNIATINTMIENFNIDKNIPNLSLLYSISRINNNTIEIKFN